MSNKLKKKKQVSHSTQTRPDSVFREAWDNMNADMARFMPKFLQKRTPKGKGKAWVVILVTLFELVVIGVVGKLLYDWLAK